MRTGGNEMTLVGNGVVKSTGKDILIESTTVGLGRNLVSGYLPGILK